MSASLSRDRRPPAFPSHLRQGLAPFHPGFGLFDDVRFVNQVTYREFSESMRWSYGCALVSPIAPPAPKWAGHCNRERILSEAGNRFAHALTGSVIAVQTFREFENFNPYLHIIDSDGCFHEDGGFTKGLNLRAKDFENAFRHEVFKMLRAEGPISLWVTPVR